ncbi:MAG TPA: HisA/HisF-related TIM barrel protein [Fimbriiglobus sp.]|nr:HisA/HisF-related TIM barrel protein [Fimbriiglobus sp.]
MRIIPVIDVMGSVVVRAVGGRREEYRQVKSRLTDSANPLVVAEVLLQTSRANELYVADLDGISGSGVLSESVRRLLVGVRVQTWLDVGLRCDFDALDLPRSPFLRPVVASETAGPAPLRRATSEQLFRLRPAYSIDLREGVLCGDWRYLGLERPDDILRLATQVYRFGYRTLIVLDLSRVGLGDGVGTEAICKQVRAALPDVELIAGGGVRDWDDVKRLEDAGADAVLVASALHGGTLTFPRPVS